MNRRTFLAAAATIAVSPGQAPPFPIIDSHIHLFDPTRPEGVPWPPKTDPILYRPAVPGRYRKVAESFGVRGAIEVECSTWLEDNQWVLDVSEKDTIMVGAVGNLDPGQPGFRQNLDRFHKNPLFRGIRYGNLWNRDVRAALANPAFLADLKHLADAGLSLDTANPTVRLLEDMLTISDGVPNLRIILDHLPRLARPQEPGPRAAYDKAMRELGQRPQVYVKVSEVLDRVDGRVPYDLDFYRPKIDELWETFGEDRLLYGSDWPNSDPLGTYEQVFSVVREYFLAKGPDAAEKYFWKNSFAAYRWARRDPSQPDPARA